MTYRKASRPAQRSVFLLPTGYQDFHSWRVWINDSPTDIRDAFAISPPIFSLTGPGGITTRETDELFVQRDVDSDQEHQS
ncbi:hypothetical protein BSZ39_10580 [Bowdeniella nasicola]|uniref:Uncharacterized protein n=1 Tax=Bowdeniella nasicola TaxID=208480 RepID=A0A1Q5Q0M3_9ACTO|nr:hypothetical protein [Bowdeniella nasicola]OKL53242.1 hypothetical protein BSZ39_10580 [Bowdeniella nasicola]